MKLNRKCILLIAGIIIAIYYIYEHFLSWRVVQTYRGFLIEQKMYFPAPNAEIGSYRLCHLIGDEIMKSTSESDLRSQVDYYLETGRWS